MNQEIREIVTQISELEEKLKQLVVDKQSQIFFKFEGRRIEFDKDLQAVHKKLKRGFFHWITTDRPQNLITGPFIYFMVMPMLLLDFTVSTYQAICFPIYRIAKVKRSQYILFDRHRLGYLNAYERLHCEYCAYASGLLAYATEIVAKTELYFCPIKHAHKVLAEHSRYKYFMQYGESENYHVHLEKIRTELAHDQVAKPNNDL
jgi:hypothetical protein